MPKLRIKLSTVISIVMIISICTACAMTFKYAHSIIEYEIEPKAYANDITDKSASNQVIAAFYDEIPYSKTYTLFVENNDICVYDAENKLIYTETLKGKEMLSESDTRELERSGIKFSTRPELIEMLNYLNS